MPSQLHTLLSPGQATFNTHCTHLHKHQISTASFTDPHLILSSVSPRGMATNRSFDPHGPTYACRSSRSRHHFSWGQPHSRIALQNTILLKQRTRVAQVAQGLEGLRSNHAKRNRLLASAKPVATYDMDAIAVSRRGSPSYIPLRVIKNLRHPTSCAAPTQDPLLQCEYVAAILLRLDPTQHFPLTSPLASHLRKIPKMM